MSVLNKIKLGAAVVIGVPVAGMVGYVAWDDYANGTGEIHVMAPIDAAVEVEIDDGKAVKVPAGSHQTFEVKQGTHEVSLAVEGGEKTSHKAEVDSGFYETLMPAKGQCFAVLDVFDTYYQSTPEMPEVLDRFEDGEAIEVGSSHYFSEGALPSQVKDNTTVKLVLDMPCKLMNAPEGKLLAELGYDEKSLAAASR